MTFVLIGFVVFLIIWFIFDRDDIVGIFAAFIGLVVFLFCYLIYLNYVYEPDYESYTNIATIKEVHENQYYMVSTNGNSVSVWLEEESGNYQKETFPEDKVTFVPTNGEAKAEILVKNFVKPDKLDRFWFFQPEKGNDKLNSVTIYVPEGSEITEQSSSAESDDSEKEGEAEVQEDVSVERSSYCTECGTKLQEGNKFCGGCGKKLKE